MNRTLRLSGWFLILIVVLSLSACGRKARCTVQGRVTLDGEPLPNGFISFYPKDKQGQNVGGTIANGNYEVPDVTPGVNRIQISITDPANPADAQPIGKSRRETNADRLGHLKRRSSTTKAAAPPRPETNFEAEVGEGTQRLDFPLETPKGKK
jgi:hypothetical protein